MFSGLKVLFSGGITSAQCKVFSKRFVEMNGVVAVREKFHPMFKPKSMAPLESDINYIIVEHRKTTLADLCRQLSCPEIPKEVTVVHKEWLEQCLNKKTLLDVASYKLKMTGDSATNGENVDYTSKRKRCEDYQPERNAVVACSSSKEDRPQQQLKVIHFTSQDVDTSAHKDEYNIIEFSPGKPSLLYKLCPLGKKSFTRMIAFDMDGTLITTKSGATFSKSVDDWKFLYPNVPSELRQQYESGALLAIISNQNGISKGHTTLSELSRKLTAILDAIGVPVDVFCAFENDIYRKPRIGSLDFLLNRRVAPGHVKNSSGDYVAARDPDLLARCLYVGDAAGRPKNGTRKKDFSSSDFKMAINAGIEFQTPEQFFLKSKQPLHCNRSLAELGLSWTQLIDSNRALLSLTSDPSFSVDDETENAPELLLLVGPPACGKSTLARSLKRTHFRVNQDLLKSKNLCFKAATDHFESIKNGIITSSQPQGVVVDATNANRSVRKEWIELARELDVPVKCVHFRATKELCFHLAAYRILSPLSLPEDKRNIEQVVIHSYFKHMEPPSLQEGFTALSEVIFSPQIPDDEEASRLLMSYIK